MIRPGRSTSRDAQSLPRTILILAALLLAQPTAGRDLKPLSPEEKRAIRRNAVVEVFDSAKDAVVNISSTRIIQMRSRSLFDEFFDFPANARVRRFKRTSVGSGFVLHRDGYIVTNAHVVSRTAERKVIFADKREFDAELIAIDEQRDLAVLKIETDKPLKPLALGTSGDLMQGETVVAIGNPLGYQHTVTRGVVSATNRKLEFDNGHEFTDLIQTDASINPGNSGGPLLNILGELIGINTAIRGDAQNIGFAIPVDQLRAVLPELLDVERRYRIVTGLKVKMQRGATISEVKPGSPAAQAKLEVGDKIVSIDGERIASDIDYHISLLGGTPGRILEVKVQRGEETKQTFLRLGERPRPDGAKLLKAHFGLSAEPMDANTAKLLGMRQPVGLTVTSVEANSPTRL